MLETRWWTLFGRLGGFIVILFQKNRIKLNLKIRAPGNFRARTQEPNCARASALEGFCPAQYPRPDYKQPNLDTCLKNSKQKDALWYVVRYATSSITKDLLEEILQRSGLDLHTQYGKAGTALHLAVFWGRIGIAQMLLLRGANLDIKNYAGYSLRDLVIQANRDSMVELITSHPLLPKAFPQHILESDDPPLHQAISRGSTNAIKQLMRERKDDLESYDRNGDTPLHLAMRMNSPKLVDLLLGHPGINPNSISRNGNTPLWMASRLQYDEITKRFLRHKGVDINFIGGRGKYDTPSSSLQGFSKSA